MNIGGLALTPNLLIFAALAGLAAITAVGVVLLENALRSALCLVANFFTLAILYFTLQAEALGIVQVVVYTGAIMVLFLFVIMLLNLGAPQLLHEKLDLKKYGGVFLGFGLFAVVGSQILPPLLRITQPKDLPGTGGLGEPHFGSPASLGRALFTNYVYPFEAVSILLLIGVVGSILLAKRRVH